MLSSPFDAAQAALQPCVRLAQANAALLAEFWFARPGMPPPFGEVQRPLFVGGSGGPSAGEWPGDALARLWRGLLENQLRFAGELMQAAPALFGAASASPAAWALPAPN